MTIQASFDLTFVILGRGIDQLDLIDIYDINVSCDLHSFAR